MSRHDKFIAEWERLGRPAIDAIDPDCSKSGWVRLLGPFDGVFNDGLDYRFAGDLHWQLRRKWIDSDKTLPIEMFFYIGPVACWIPDVNPQWRPDRQYREAKQPVMEPFDTMTNPNTPQPDPVKNEHPCAWSLVIKDMAERDLSGLQKYGTRLQPHNGRKSLVDAYQEVLDLAVYLRAEIYEQTGK